MRLKTINSCYYGAYRKARIITAPKAAARIRDEYANAAAHGMTSLEQAYGKASWAKWAAMREAHDLSSASAINDGDDCHCPTCYIAGINTFSFNVYWSTSAGVYKLARDYLYFVPNP